MRTVPAELAGLIPQELHYELDGLVEELIDEYGEPKDRDPRSIGLVNRANGSVYPSMFQFWMMALSILNARKIIELKSSIPYEGG